MSSNTSIGPGAQRGGNEDHGNADGRGNKTLGESGMPEPEVGNDVTDTGLPAGVPGAKAKPGISRGPGSYPDGPNVETSPWELEAARGNPPKQER